MSAFPLAAYAPADTLRVQVAKDTATIHAHILRDGSEMHNLCALELQVLLALQKLVNALGPESPGCYPLLLPILQHSLDISQVSQLT